jgi:hypothetical protein
LLWDELFAHIVSGARETVESGKAVAGSAGIVKKTNLSGRTYNHAVNSPVGRLTHALFQILWDMKPNVGVGIPIPIRVRLECLLAQSGDVKDHGLAEMTARLSGLYQLDAEWTKQHLLFRFDPNHVDAEPAWSGYTAHSHLAGHELFAEIKEQLLRIFPCFSLWYADDSALRHWITALIWYRYMHQDGAGMLVMPRRVTRCSRRRPPDDSMRRGSWCAS